MKYLAALALFLFSNNALAIHVKSHQAGIDLDTSKVSRLESEIDDTLAFKFLAEASLTMTIPGDRVIIINSLGGYLSSGNAIIKIMEAEKSVGVRQICVVEGDASSMAFNILTHCDVRLATASSRFLIHKAAIADLPPGVRGTAKNLRGLANEIEREDKGYSKANCAAMHLTRKEYDENADEERTWYADKLYEIGYLQGLIKLAP